MKRTSSMSALEFPPPQPPSHRNKKTRELPNLSDCNCCNRRINSTNPKNRLGILTSEWRIVLLCKSCYNLVESSQFCSYCLTRVSSEFYDCKKCRRRIHKDCVSKFDFGYSGNFCDEFSVCFDCWIPNLLENDFNRSRTVRNVTSKKVLGKNGVESVSLSSSGLCNLQEKRKLLENVRNGTSKKELGNNGMESTLSASNKGKLLENEANVVAEKKINVAVETKEKVFGEVIEAKKGMEVASEALGIVEIDKGGDKGGLVVDKDAQLAIRLHKDMNSSRRLLRNMCLLSTHCVDAPKANGLKSRGVNETSSSGRETNVICSNGLQMSYLLGQERNRLSGERQECENLFGRIPDRKCNGVSKDCVITYIRKGQAPNIVKCKEEPGIPLKVYSRKPCHVKLEAGENSCQALKLEGADRPFQVLKVEAGQCSKTYTRRRLYCQRKLLNSSLNLENGNLAPDMSLTCCEESKALTNAS